MVKSEWGCISQEQYSWWYYSHSVMPHAWLPMLDGNALAVSRTRDGAGRKRQQESCAWDVLLYPVGRHQMRILQS